MAVRQVDVGVRYTLGVVDKGLRQAITMTQDLSKQTRAATAQVDRSLRANSTAWKDAAKIASSADRQIADQAAASGTKVSAALNKTVVGLRKQGVAYKEIAGAARGWGATANEAAAAVERASAREVASLKRVEMARSRLKSTVGLGGGAGLQTSAVGAAGGAVGRGMSRVGSAIGQATIFAAPAVAFESVKLAASFQSQMMLLHTQAGASMAEVNKLSAAVLKVAPELGILPVDAAKALFHIESLGHHGADAMNLLTISAKGAKIGHADLEATTNLLATTMKTANVDVHGMAATMGVLNETIGHGNLRMNELTDALGTGVLVAAKGAGFGLKSVGAALDVLTARGFPAVDAATKLKMAFVSMQAGSKGAEAALNGIGLSHDKLATAMRGPGGLPSAITMLSDHLKASGKTANEQAAIMVAVFGKRALAPILALTQHAGELQQRFHDLGRGDSVKKFGQLFADNEKTASAYMERLKATFAVLGVQLGNVLLPIAIKFGEFLTKSVVPPLKSMVGVVKDATHWLHQHKTVLEAVKIALAGLVAGFVALKAISFATRLVRGLTNDFRNLAGIMKSPLSMFKAQEGESAALARSQTVLAEANVRLAGSFDAVAVSAKAAAGGEVLARDAGGLGGVGPVGKAGGKAAITAERGLAGGTVEAAALSQVVAQETQQRGLLGALYGRTGATTLASKAASTTAPAAAAAGVGAAAAGGAAEAGLLARLGARLGPALGIAGIGITAAQLGGGAIGGRTGKAVASIGTGAAAGAAAGTLIAPGIGTAIGGLGGAALGSLQIPAVAKVVKSTLADVGKFITQNLGITKRDFADLGKAFHNVGTALSAAFRAIQPVLRAFADLFKQAFSGVIQIVGGFVKVIGALLSGDFGRVWTGVKQILAGAVQYFVSFVALITLPLRAFVGWIGGVFVAGVKAAWNIVSTAFTAAAGVITSIVSTLFGWLKATWDTLTSVFTVPLRAAWDAVKGVFGFAKGMVSGEIHAVVDVVNAVWHTLTSTVPHAVSTAFDAAVGVIKGAVGAVTGAAQTVVDGFVNVFKGIGGAIGDALKAAINVGIGAVNLAIDGINTIIDGINSVSGSIPIAGGSLSISHIGHAPTLAAGGFVPGSPHMDGTLAMLAGNEFVLTGHGQSMLDMHAPGLLDHIAASQMPHFATGGHIPKGRIPRFAGGGPVWSVTASQESLGGNGYQGNPIVADGYSELSIPPSSLNFSGLGHLPFHYPLKISANGKTVTALKQDIGAGSSFNPVMGLYPGTTSQLGLSGGEFHIKIQAAGGQAVHPMIGSQTSGSLTSTGAGSTPSATAGAAARTKTTTSFVPAGPGLYSGFDAGYFYGLDPTASGVTTPAQALQTATLGAQLKKIVKTTTIPGAKTSSTKGTPAGAAAGDPAPVKAMIRRANAITNAHYPYVFGGGHGSGFGPTGGGYDCSGAVSSVLHAGGYLGSPEATGALAGFGAGGAGRYVTVYVENSSAGGGHTIMSLDGRLFGTHGGSAGGIGGEWLPGSNPNSFAPRPWEAVRHPPGLRKGGWVNPAFKNLPQKAVDKIYSGRDKILPGLRRGGHLPRFQTGGFTSAIARRAPVTHITKPPTSHAKAPAIHITKSGKTFAPDLPTALQYTQIQAIADVIALMPVETVNYGLDATQYAATATSQALFAAVKNRSVTPTVGHAFSRLAGALRNADHVSTAHLSSSATAIEKEIAYLQGHTFREHTSVVERVRKHGKTVRERVSRTTLIRSRHHETAADRKTVQALQQALGGIDYLQGVRNATSQINAALTTIGKSGDNAKIAKAMSSLSGAVNDVSKVSYERLQQVHDTLVKEINQVDDPKGVSSQISTLAHQRTGLAKDAAKQRVTLAHHHTGKLHTAAEKKLKQDETDYAGAARTIAGLKALPKGEQAARRLSNALQLIDRAMGDRVGVLVAGAENEAASIQAAQTRLTRLMDRKGIDAASVQGTEMLSQFNDQAVAVLKDVVAKLQTAYKMAVKSGDTKAIADVGGKLKTALDNLDQGVTDRIVAARAAVVAIGQALTDASSATVQGWQTAGTQVLARQGIDQASARGATILSDIQNALVKSLQGTVGGLYALYSKVVQSGDQGAITTVGGLLQTALANLQQGVVDQITAGRNAVEAIGQEATDTATHAASAAQTGEQQFQVGQQLSGTSGTPGGNQALADYINKNVIPAVVAELPALMKQQAIAKYVGDTKLAQQIGDQIQTVLGDVQNEQLNAMNAVKANTAAIAANTDTSGTLGVTYQSQNLPDLAGTLNGV